MIFIWLGILLLALAVLFALPFFGVGIILPILGDIIDIPLSFFFALLGVVFLFIGGIEWILTTYWWLLIVLVIVYIIILFIKTKKVMRRHR